MKGLFQGECTSHYAWGMMLVLVLFCSTILLTISSPVASAVTTVPTKINFQGRLTNSAGNIMPDGQYNMKFRLFAASSGGSALWTETRETSSRVTITNGLFSVRLGDVTPVPASLFASGTLYLEVELPSQATATCSTAACGAYTEGPMSPRSQLATSAYAFNSETLDGLDSAAFVQTASNNTLTGTNLFKPASDSATGFVVQDAAGVGLFTADSVNDRLYVGNVTADATGVALVLDTKNTAGDPTGVNGAMYWNESTDDFRCYVNGGWQSCQARSAGISGVVTSGSTITSTTYANLTPPSSVSFTKLGGTNTKLVVTMSATMYTTVAAGTGAYLGVNVDSTDYDCGNLYFNNINLYGTVACSVTIPNVTAGSKTLQMRWKRGLGTGSLNSSANSGWNSMTVMETN